MPLDVLRKSLFVLFLLFAAAAASRAADDSLFPFVLPWDDASPGVTNVSGLLEKPAGGRGFVIAKEGHLFEGGKRLRIFGVNTAFGANFPTHADAEKVAARMAKFGINCVRLHHMDNQTAPGGLMSADMKTLDPGQLDKLDYFIAQLKKNGIYVDMNLHVSRIYPGMPKWEGMPGYFKGVDNFYTPMIAMQRDYARQLLTHVNPYTNAAYIDEPAVAIIEINDENGLLGEWGRGSLDTMPEDYWTEFNGLWNRWLQTKYSSDAALAKAWNAGQEPVGAEMLKDVAFENAPGPEWPLEQIGTAKAGATPDGGGLKISVSQTDGIGWHVQISQAGIEFFKSRHYTATFRARSDTPHKITVGAALAHAPWNVLWSTDVELGTKWQEYRFTFQPSADDAKGRLMFSNLGASKGDYWLANVSLRPGGVSGLQTDEKLGKLPGFKKADFGKRTDAAQADWKAFLYDTEAGYWTGMESFLKDELKARSLIVGTATGFSPPSIQAKLDVVDSHAYWQHPRFPHKQWDPNDWTVSNIPMAGVADGGTLPDLAEHRVAGKPFICTEYNEAAPNTHSSEAFLLLNAYAALQDWDGVFAFAYSHRHDDWDSQRICSFFDIDQHPVKLATLPAAVAMFLRGDIARAAQVVTYPVSPAAVIDLSRPGPWWGMEQLGMPKMLPMQSRVQMDLSAHPSVALSGTQQITGVTRSDTGELAWDADKGCVMINARRNKAFIGKITGEPIHLGDVVIEPGKDRMDWAAITLTSMNGPGTPILITATGYAENTGMQWTSPERNSVGVNWGKAPSLVEGIPAKITLPVRSGDVKAWALDERGQRKEAVDVTRTDFGATIEIEPKYQTLWYEIDVAR